MVTFLQVMVLLVMIFLLVVTINRFHSKKINFFGFLFWCIVWLGVLVMSFVPGLLGGVAKFSGTNPRDLVVHLSLVVLFYLLFLFDSRIADLRSDIKKLKEVEKIE